MSTLDDLHARQRTLSYEQERSQKKHAAQQAVLHRIEAEVTGWKARCEDTEKRLKMEQDQVKELREEIIRGRKAMEGIKMAAVVRILVAHAQSVQSDRSQHEAKKNQLKLDKAQQQLARLANDASSSTRPQGLVLLNPISGGRSYPVAVRVIRCSGRKLALTARQAPAVIAD